MRNTIIWFTVLVLALVCCMGFCINERGKSEATNGTSTNENLTAFAIAGVKDNISKIRSGRISYTYTAFAHGEDAFNSSMNPDDKVYSEHTLVFDEKKFKDSANEVSSEKGLKMETECECFFDGEKSGLHFADEERAIIWNGWSDDIVGSSISYSFPLPYSYQIEVPAIYEKLVASNPKAIGEVTVDGLRCIQLEGKLPNGGRNTWYVCPDYGFSIIRSERETKVDHPEEESAHGETVSSDFAQFDGVWLPRKQQIAVVYNAPDGNVTRQVFFSISVKNIELNLDINPSEFKPNLTPKTDIMMKK